jgi:hypothetical protein
MAHTQTWPGFELRSVEDALAREFPFLSLEVITMVVAMAKTHVQPLDGRAELLSAAREKLSR